MKNLKSWKTTLAGVLTLLPQILHVLFPEQVSSQTADALSALFASCGLAVSKDHDVTGNPAVTVGEDVPEKKN